MGAEAISVLAFLLYASAAVTCIENFGDEANSTEFLPVANRHGETVLMSVDLMQKLAAEQEEWHWMPWLRTRTYLDDHVLREVTCAFSSSSDSFPDSILTDEQLQRGGFVLYAIFGIYAFTLLAIVCNDYFIPCVELICEDLQIPQNVAAATFMSVATSCPEFFVNVISTFLTESDMGIGTIIGSAIFNALGVAAIGGLAARKPIAIEMRPVTRDVLIYMVVVSVLVAIVWDGQVDWYEAMVLGILYVLYFIFMFNSMRIFGLIDKIIGKGNSSNSTTGANGSTSKVEEGTHNKAFEISHENLNQNSHTEKAMVDIQVTTANGSTSKIEEGTHSKPFEISHENLNQNSQTEKAMVAIQDVDISVEKKQRSTWTYPKGKSLLYQAWWLYSFPLRLLLGLTIPSPVTRKRFYPLAFVMCIIWIGVNSYFVTWSMTVIGNTFLIPDSVMGMTFLAFGGCLPEACSIFIMSRRGEGGIGVSNALGANSLAIMFALGVPWLIRTVALEVQGADQTAVLIDSSGIGLVVGSLLLAVTCLWITLYIGKFTLRKTVGAVLICLYAVFITFAILVETGILFDTALSLMC